MYGLDAIAVDLKDFSRLFYNLNNIRNENLNLLRENEDLRGIIVELKNAEEENVILREQLSLSEQFEFEKELLLADVLGNPNDLSGSSVILDKGSRHGVAVGDNVIRGSFLIGVVSEISSERSLVKLITSPEVSATVYNIDNPTTEGLVKGNLGTTLVVSRILPGESVEIGDSFVTSGKDGNFIRGLSVGSVESIVFDPSEPLKSVLIVPSIDLDSISKVFVLLTDK